MNIRPSIVWVAVGIVGLSACDKPNKDVGETPSQASAPREVAAAVPSTVNVTVLVTVDENGYLLPQDPAKKGGAAQVLGVWKTEDHHQTGHDAATLALSTGDHWGGASISSFFSGEPMAEAMATMGYAATGLGNHDFDFGRDQFQKNIEKAKIETVATNVAATDGGAPKFAPVSVFERKGFKIGVLALTSLEMPKTTMSGRFDGLSVTPFEPALMVGIASLRQRAVDAVIVLVDECPTVLSPVFQKHADWAVAAVVGGHCSSPVDSKVGTVALKDFLESSLRSTVASRRRSLCPPRPATSTLQSRVPHRTSR